MEITDVLSHAQSDGRSAAQDPVNIGGLLKELSVFPRPARPRTGEGLSELVRIIAGVIDSRIPTSPRLLTPLTAAKERSTTSLGRYGYPGLRNAR
jgi:hypothetical protein